MRVVVGVCGGLCVRWLVEYISNKKSPRNFAGVVYCVRALIILFGLLAAAGCVRVRSS